MAERPDLPIEPVARRTGFVTEREPLLAPCQFVDQLSDRLRPVGDGAEEPYLAALATLGERYRRQDEPSE
jgi:hypothetical protein